MASVLDAVKYYQQSIEKHTNDEDKILKCIDKLFHLDVTTQHLQETGVGRTVNALRKDPGEVGTAARSLVYKWKRMVAAEESDHEGDHRNDSSMHNGNGSGKESDDNSKHHKSRQEQYERSDAKPSHTQHRQINGHSTENKRKYHSSEEEEPNTKKIRHSVSDDDHKKPLVKQEKLSDSESDDDSDSSESDSDSYTSESSREDTNRKEIKQEVKIKKEQESLERHKLHKKHSNHEDHRRDSSSSKQPQEPEKPSNHSSKVDSSRSETSSKSHSHKHKTHERETSSDKRHKSEHKSPEEKRESKESNRHSSSERQKSSSHKTDHNLEKHKSSSDGQSSKSDRHKSSDKDSDKHKSSSQTEKDRERHKSASRTDKDGDSHKILSERDSTKHRSKESSGSSSKDKHSSSSKDKSKDRSSSYKDKSSSHSEKRSSSDSKSQERAKEKSEDRNEKKSKEKSSSSSHKSKSSSKSKDEEPKKKSKKSNSEENEEGIDCGSGASFAEALGMMVSPTKPKKKSYKDFSPSNSFNNDLSPAALLAPTAKLAPLMSLEISALPEISPNYKPRPPPKPMPHFTDEEALSASISSKNQRTKVYSGNKTVLKVTSLYAMCVSVLQEHIDALEYTGGVPYDILKPVIDKATPNQLFVLEHYNPYLMEDTDHLWQKNCEKHFRNKKRQEMETWREMYMRCQEEQECKLKSLTANIRMTQEAKKAPIKQTKMAYVDNFVKPPRNVARKQAIHGTAHSATASPAARVASLASGPNVLKGGAPRPPNAAPVSSTSFNKPKKAPLMQKALQLMRGRKR